MLFALLSFTAAKFLVPVPQDDLDTLNSLLRDQVIPNTNHDMKTKLQSQGLDPLHDVVNGSSSKPVNMKVCKGLALSTFSIEDLNGLSNVLIGNITITGADVADDGISTTFDINANINPLDLDAHVSGRASVSCGVLKPHVGISGIVRARQLALAVVAKALVVTDNGFKILKVTFDDVNVDFRDVKFQLDGKVDRIFNPLLDSLLPAVERLFKKKILRLVDGKLKSQLQTLVQAKLPLVVNL